MQARFTFLKRMAVVASLLVNGCGEGPKHLSREDYLHGKAAFELLENYEKTSNESFESSAENQIEGVSPKPSGLREALTSYDRSLILRHSVDLELESAELSKKRAILEAELSDTKISEESVKQIVSKQSEAEIATREIQPIIKICHDDAAQFFDATAASTNSCSAELSKFHSRHESF
jgi:hypothetical protein